VVVSTGDVQEAVTVILHKSECGGNTLLETVITDSNGNFSFNGLLNGDYTVMPVKAGYSFSPVIKSVTFSNASENEVDFTATSVP
jgi:uncharacterized surface anchored protein